MPCLHLLRDGAHEPYRGIPGAGKARGLRQIFGKFFAGLAIGESPGGLTTRVATVREAVRNPLPAVFISPSGPYSPPAVTADHWWVPSRPFDNSRAFAAWAALGDGRSLETIARRFGVSLARIQREADEGRWQARLDAVEGKADPQSGLIAQLEEMDERHLKMARAIQGRALEILMKTPLRTTEAAVRALDVAMNQERSVRDRQARGRPLKAKADPMQVQMDRLLIKDAKKAQ